MTSKTDIWLNALQRRAVVTTKIMEYEDEIVYLNDIIETFDPNKLNIEKLGDE